MRAGWLRHRITINKKVVVQNSYGEEDITWTALATVWASIEPLRGRELTEVRREEAEVNTRIRCRYRADVSPEMQVVWTDANSGTRTYDVMSVIRPFERQREMQMMCREVL